MKVKATNPLSLAIAIALLLITSLASAQTSGQPQNKEKASQPNIYLVGMGPGAADLITVGAQQAVRKAHLIICNSMLAKQFSSLLAGKELLVTGEKSCLQKKDLADESVKRDRIIKSVRNAVKANKVVALLDHGDPMVYGNWLWCLNAFKDLTIKVEPGVCLFHAANAALRDDISFSELAKSIIITTNDAPGQKDAIDRLASKFATMVIYCKKNKFATMLAKLSKKYASDTPIALVFNAGDIHKEKVVRGAIANIAETVAKQKLPNDFIVFVGANLDKPQCRARAEKEKGRLYLAGLFLGNADLATLRTVNLIKKSDLIVDKSDLLKKGFNHKLLPQGKEVWKPSDNGAWQWFGYGKSADDFSGKQLERFLAAEKARKETAVKVRQAIKNGKQVCILDSGDPLTYSPWAWVLREFADLCPIVLPGVSSFDAANAVLQKSVTKGVNTKSVIITVPDVEDWLNKTCFDFDAMLERQTSLVIFMPDYLVTLPDMVKKLSAYYDRKTPIALVANAGFKNSQRVIKGRLDNIVELVGKEKMPILQLMYVGPFLH
ncbi:SAM-dependent methyltransferase [Dethiosulfatarculus sandiegensis]|uniref:Tetrapyrrole methylase domain-containing protein n=1 Tax=Dethiosulfatarculus sandiegensis TaxID=1429043 RepID=A0A0D2J4J4_9BACT|nr:SAM-dependent methyltransferase [Dethiosulfatarculus sandiegensis]KIX13014.1 hypothetical protein X474_16405 [Dethiosulfatarculus sandiegensis]